MLKSDLTCYLLTCEYISSFILIFAVLSMVQLHEILKTRPNLIISQYQGYKRGQIHLKQRWLHSWECLISMQSIVQGFKKILLCGSLAYPEATMHITQKQYCLNNAVDTDRFVGFWYFCLSFFCLFLLVWLLFYVGQCVVRKKAEEG